LRPLPPLPPPKAVENVSLRVRPHASSWL
jgi:hypothetical protein